METIEDIEIEQICAEFAALEVEIDLIHAETEAARERYQEAQ